MTQTGGHGRYLVDSRAALSYERDRAERGMKMTRRFSDLLILMLLGLGIALAPIACASNNDDPNDGAVDTMTPS
jgi:hypothetical protein